ncbi:hypothetical protein DRO69_06950 [Candidatus Bathyarchaeota archaeon]|nr:MAG: hypothetical protein DRO69_06950 [Candidatus Bathyarchaeota archaeon]
MKIKARALRHRVWFKILSKAERAIIDLTIKCVERIRSRILTNVISKILDKILKTLKNNFLDIVNKVGRETVERLCRIAKKWGNKAASSWKYDLVFIRFLGINATNTWMTYK